MDYCDADKVRDDLRSLKWDLESKLNDIDTQLGASDKYLRELDAALMKRLDGLEGKLHELDAALMRRLDDLEDKLPAVALTKSP
ncbi:MAG: hypothetical protein HS104_26905 [Polyangiaceae bacterium]|nr:hypothetical protein [Polyangiaceae bacterium]